MSTSLRILFVGMGGSIHVARWIGQLRNRAWDIRLFPVDDIPLNPELRDVTAYNYFNLRPRGLHSDVRLVGSFPLSKGASRAKALIGRFFPLLADRPSALARVIDRFRPNIVHALEIQHAAYLVLEARKLVRRPFPAWIVTNYGSDIYFFGPQPEHGPRIREVLTSCDYYACECKRDVVLAREFGFKGQVLPVQPNGGGFDLRQFSDYREPGPTSARRTIALKGYQGWSGRALIGTRALEKCADVLGGFRVVVYLASPEVRRDAERISRSTGIPFDFLPQSPHEQVLRLHGRSRVSIGLGVSDGISTSALEAMVMGAFPVQSSSSCAGEYFVPGRGGLLVPAEDSVAVADAIRRAVTDDALVDEAARLNAEVARQRLDRATIEARVVSMYERIGASARRLGSGRLKTRGSTVVNDK